MCSQQSFMSLVNNKDSSIVKRDLDRLCCAKCRFSTKDAELFERHVSHHKEVTFSCALCSHVSYSKTESQKHIVSHTGSYPYRCSFCSYGAVRRDYMVKHILRIHKKDAVDGLILDAALSTPACGHPSVPNTPGMSGWPKRNDQSAVPNSHAEHPSGRQTRANRSFGTDQAVSQTSSGCARVTCIAPFVASTTAVAPVSKTQISGAIPSCTPSASHTPQVVLRSREENSNLSNSPFNAIGQSKLTNRRTILEKPFLKSTFQRVHCSSTEALQQSARLGVPEKAMHSKTIPRVQIRPPVEMNTPLRPLLNMPLSKRKVQMDPRASVSATGTNVAMQKTSATAVLPNVQIRSPPTAENRTNCRIGSSATTSGPLSSVQVELLAPLNQPIQHNKPLTVSCPEEINIPAGCLVELVEVKNVNGTRELELRLVPPSGVPQEQRSTVNGPLQVASEGKLSFKCQVTAKECPVSPSTSSPSHKTKQTLPSACGSIQGIANTVPSAHKQQSSETPGRNRLNLRNKGPGVKRSAAAHNLVTPKGPELNSEGLPVISSVFSLCPTPTQSVIQSSAETRFWTGAKKQTKDKADQSLVCSILIKKEEEPEEKPKGALLDLKETKTEHENNEDSTVSEAQRPLKTPKPSGDLKQGPLVTQPSSVPIVSSTKDNISHPDKECGRSLDSQQLQSCAPLMYPKVALVRIPSSMLESIKKLPEAPTQDQSLTARPVLCCTLREQNVPGGPEVSIKLILKRDLRESEDHDPPPRKKHKKEKKKAKKRRSSLVEMGLSRSSSADPPELRLTPLKADQRVTRPSPNQPVVVLNHPNPLAQTVNVAVQTLKNYKWIRSPDQEEQTTQNQPSLKMKLKKVNGQNYQVIELVLKGVSEKRLV